VQARGPPSGPDFTPSPAAAVLQVAVAVAACILHRCCSAAAAFANLLIKINYFLIN